MIYIITFHTNNLPKKENELIVTPMSKLGHIPVDAMKEMLLLQSRLENLDKQDEVQDSFLDYINYIWPEFIRGNHHKVFADKLTEIAKGDIKRLIVNMPPRHTKSEFASVYFPSWVMGLKPNMKIMQTTHTSELSIRFGRKVRNLMDTEEYKAIFPKVTLSADSTRNKMRYHLRPWNPRMNGTLPALVSGYSLAVPL